ncbi:hypothetical protein M9H77_21692 [Catharanthus roseus]|uniref:Uncharacterized protein n=1 Tax=Catharanthus roseus TaxID=4058 RepID=A0ACC0AQD4_CATRO|nr:hypothetical protein M9H77_21692 [Catharanthus roseus]
MENGDDIQSPRNTLTPPKSPLCAPPITIEALYNSQCLLVLQYKDEICNPLQRLVNERGVDIVKTMVLMEPSLFKTFDQMMEIEEATKKKETARSKKGKELVYISSSADSFSSI